MLAGRYEIGALLGRGGMAEVHEGLDTRLNRRVAIKLLRPSLATDPSFRTRFRQEAQAAARMAHPTIVRVFDAGEETIRTADGHEVQLPFIVMERIEGTLLSDLIAEGPVPSDEAARIATGILTALEYSHRAGVVHRDIKPGNVMITPNGQVKVMDFGIARAVSESSANVAQTSAVLGTASYFSPEQARGEAVDARTDLYSTGVVLYEMLTGRAPFRADTPVAIAYQHVSELPTPPNAITPAVSPAMSAVVLHALAKDRFERFQSAAEFKADLEIAAGGKVPDRVPGSDDFNATLFGVNPNSTAASEATLRRLANDEDRPVRTQSRPPVAWIWGGVALMIVVIVAALVWVFSLTPGNYLSPDAAIVVPDVVGQEAEVGVTTLTDAGLRVSQVERPNADVEEGVIVSMSIDAGARVSPGESIELVISSGAPSVTLPALTYQSEADAIKRIEDLGLSYGETRNQGSPNVPKGQVIAVTVGDDDTTHTRQMSVPANATINLIVSTGLVTVPDVVGDPIASAQSEMQSLQLVVKLSPDSSCAGQTVKSQSVKGDVEQRSSITLTYCSN
ncbi:Stk1 family PASTA domain-containing Ser/Thr kinase [Homoserinibacter sp. GY 40078]|uniref:Stk1 family PASTA domain-containing Ser/Thr kinase n=1 Tax=Homoserinibacter sp. GY 40078 TaxID=2603275 RepID=UPI0011C77D66|nr:Stk1 family PASTA domain-containing Ser/Thr kinase [Homoserinibacter sp. GY 40078]TXK19959.1 Stk1 family PASTA domain-containing Ser/Thr kinase [Homoserinibacter sp. GY 40078]